MECSLLRAIRELLEEFGINGEKMKKGELSLLGYLAQIATKYKSGEIKED